MHYLRHVLLMALVVLSALVFTGVAGAVIEGTPGNDTLVGNNFANTFYAYAGDDFVDGKGQEDTIFGNGGGDLLYGGADSDYIEGNSGVNDLLHGEGAGDTLDTHDGDFNDFLDGGDGTNDTCKLDRKWGVNGLIDQDEYSNCEHFVFYDYGTF